MQPDYEHNELKATEDHYGDPHGPKPKKLGSPAKQTEKTARIYRQQ